MPEVESSFISPRDNHYLLGHEAEEKFLLDAWQNNSLHNSWLISGIEGIGKATLAYRFARFLLNVDESRRGTYTNLDVSPDSPAFKLVSNNSHPDLKVIERDYTDTDRRKILKAIKEGEQLGSSELKDLKKSAFIRVDDVRTINEFLSKRSSNDGWRVVIIDSIDDMNINSANAVLKILEEPPYKTLMMLISHNPNKLLPTIRSRCAKLLLKPLETNIVASLLRRYRPELSETEIKKSAAIASGSIGKAINYIDHDALSIYDDLNALINSKDKLKIVDLLNFCNMATASEEAYYLTQELILKFLSENIKKSPHIIELSQSWDESIRIFDETDRLNLDKKQALINIIVNISKRI